MHFREKVKTAGFNDSTNVVLEWYPTAKNKGDFDIICAVLKSVVEKYAGSRGIPIGFEPLRHAPKKSLPLQEEMHT